MEQHPERVHPVGVVDVEPKGLAGRLLDGEHLDLGLLHRESLLDRLLKLVQRVAVSFFRPVYAQKKVGPGPPQQGSGT